jgi:hypothetical protein
MDEEGFLLLGEGKWRGLGFAENTRGLGHR